MKVRLLLFLKSISSSVDESHDSIPVDSLCLKYKICFNEAFDNSCFI